MINKALSVTDIVINIVLIAISVMIGVIVLMQLNIIFLIGAIILIIAPCVQLRLIWKYNKSTVVKKNLMTWLQILALIVSSLVSVYMLATFFMMIGWYDLTTAILYALLYLSFGLIGLACCILNLVVINKIKNENKEKFVN